MGDQTLGQILFSELFPEYNENDNDDGDSPKGINITNIYQRYEDMYL